MIEKVIIGVVLAVLTVVAAVLSAALLGFIVMVSWNLSIAAIFPSVPEINYVEGAFLYILASTLFKSPSAS